MAAFDLTTSPDGVMYIADGDMPAGVTAASSMLLAAIHANAKILRDVVDGSLSVGSDGPTGGPAYGYVAGNWYRMGGAGLAVSSSTTVAATNRLELSPWTPRADIEPDEIGMQVSAGTGGATVRVVIYESDADGWPDTLLFESEALDASATATVTTSTDMPSLTGGTQYWIGTHQQGSATYRSHGTGNLVSFGGLGSGNTSTTEGSVIRRTVTYASGAPGSFVFDASEILNNSAAPAPIFLA